MSRKPLEHALPPLAVVLPDRTGLRHAANQSAALRQRLRQVATAVRRHEPVPFYTLREVAAYCEAPLNTVARVYRELASEGSLILLRGSRTLLRGRKVRSRVPVRGVVGLPIWQYGYCKLGDWRYFFMQLEEQLRAAGYLANFIFFDSRERLRPDFVERLLRHQLDYLLWFEPIPDSVPAMRQVADVGVTVAVVTGQPARFPFLTYGLSWDRALQRGFRHWKKAGVRRVVVPHEPGAPDQVRKLILELAQQAGLESQCRLPSARSPAEWLAALPRTREDGFCFEEYLWFNRLCATVPQAVVRLLRETRLLALHRLDLERHDLVHTRVDLAVMNWRKVATAIARDLAAGKLHQARPPQTFQAQWLARADAAEYASEL